MIPGSSPSPTLRYFLLSESNASTVCPFSEWSSLTIGSLNFPTLNSFKIAKYRVHPPGVDAWDRVEKSHLLLESAIQSLRQFVSVPVMRRQLFSLDILIAGHISEHCVGNIPTHAHSSRDQDQFLVDLLSSLSKSVNVRKRSSSELDHSTSSNDDSPFLAKLASSSDGTASILSSTCSSYVFNPGDDKAQSCVTSPVPGEMEPGPRELLYTTAQKLVGAGIASFGYNTGECFSKYCNVS